jgi:hypothetical protein
MSLQVDARIGRSAARTGLAAAVACATLAASVLVIAGQSDPNAANPLKRLGLGAEARAHRAAEDGAVDAAALNQRVLEIAPAAARPWNRKAYLSGRGGMTPETLDALRRSYTVAPFGPTDSDWRLTYLYENWSDLPVDLRRSARLEHRTLLASGRRLAVDPARIESPSGRTASALNRAAGRRDRAALLDARRTKRGEGR